jgi:CDP-paratose 2-epimerase
MKTALVTGSSGLIGSETVDYFCSLGWKVHGVDNNMRADFFGPAGDTRWNQSRLLAKHKHFQHHELDIRDRAAVLGCMEALKPTAIVHTAAQPSHDLAASRPFDDFDVNASDTLNLLESTRRYAPEAVFVHTIILPAVWMPPAINLPQPKRISWKPFDWSPAILPRS